MPIIFTDTFLADTKDPLALEDVYRMYGAFAGVFDVDFDDYISDAFADLGDWTEVGGSWTAGTGIGVASGSGTSGEDFDVLYHNTEAPASYVAEIELGEDCDHACVVFRGTDNTNFYVYQHDQYAAAFYKVVNGTSSKISEYLYSTSARRLDGPGTLRVAVREMSFSGYDYDRWLFMSAWIDDYFILATADNIPGTLPGYKFGLAVANTEVTEIESVRIPDLYFITPTATLDPGEAPANAIQRAVVDRVVKSFVRYDGTLRAWVPKASSNVQVFDKSTELTLNQEHDTRELANHVRLYYALNWTEAFDADSIEEDGYRFAEVQSAIIENEPEAYAEALAHIRRLREVSKRITFESARGGLLLEPEDRITGPDEVDYIVDSISLEYNKGTIVAQIDGRLYAF